MDVIISNPVPHGTVNAPPSKSCAHRCLICSALADLPTEICCPATNDDISRTADCLSALGTEITYNGEYYSVTPLDRDAECGKRITLDCGESASTLRFLLPLCAMLGADAEFVMRGRLSDRPLSPLKEEMQRHGVSFASSGNRFSISGRLTPGHYSYDGTVSSQFTTGLLFSLPALGAPSEITLTSRAVSRPYIDLTVTILGKFGITVSERNGTFTVTPSRYASPGIIEVEGDWSGGSALLACGAFSDAGVTVRGLDTATAQGDRAILRILSNIGAKVTQSGNDITVRHGDLHGISVCADDIPDLVPVISAVTAAAEGETVIKHISRLRTKESDRIDALCKTLSSLGADIAAVGDTLVIRGKRQLTGGSVNSFGDHRIAMAAAVASCACRGDVIICGAECIAKSYPAFFNDFGMLCGTTFTETR